MRLAAPPCWVPLLPPPTFFAPLMNTLIPTTTTGSATITYGLTSNGPGSVTDWEGLIKRTGNSEARFLGARRVANLIAKSEDFSNAAWTKTSGTITATIADPDGGTTAFTFTATGANGTVYQQFTGQRTTDTRTTSIWMRRRTGTGAITLYAGGTGTVITSAVTSSWQRLSVTATTGATTFCRIILATSGDAVDIWHPLHEDVTGQSNTNPSEYVSSGVLSAPYHGAGVDAVKYFATKNGNTVSSNVVTEATGAAINTANGGSTLSTDAVGPRGFLVEYAHNNSLINSEDLSAWTGPFHASASQATGVASPAGYITPNAIIEDGTNNIHSIDQFSNKTPSATSFACLWIKAATRTEMLWRFSDGAGSTISCVITALNTTPVFTFGVTGTGYTLLASGSVAYPNGWYRVWMKFTGSTSATHSWQNWPRVAGNVTYTGTNGAAAVYLWGMTYIEGITSSHLMQYCPYPTSRSSEDLSYVFASNASATAGTAYAETQVDWVTTQGFTAGPLLAFGNSTNFPLYSNNEASTTIRIGDGTNTVQKTGLSDMGTAVRKVASSWGGTRLMVTAGGASPATGTFDGNIGSTEIAIGMPSTYNGNAWCGTIRNVRIYTAPATAAQLITLTT